MCGLNSVMNLGGDNNMDKIFKVEYVEVNKEGEVFIEGRVTDKKDIPRMLLVFSKDAWAELKGQLCNNK